MFIVRARNTRTVFFFTTAQQPLLGQGLINIEDSRTHSDTPQSIGFLWTSDKPNAEISTLQHTTLTTYTHAPGGIEPTIPASERPQTHALDRAATGIGQVLCY